MNECKMLEDLYPLYREGLLNEETAAFVKGHLQTCPHCKTQYEVGIPQMRPTPEGLDALKRVRKKLRNRTVLLSACSVALAAVIATSAYFAARLVDALQEAKLYPAFLDSFLYDSPFDFPRGAYDDDKLIKMPALEIGWTEPESTYQFTDETYRNEETKLAPYCSAPIIGEGTITARPAEWPYNYLEYTVSPKSIVHVEFKKDETCARIERKLRPEVAHAYSKEELNAYRTYLAYVEEHVGTSKIALDRFIFEYNLDAVTTASPYEQIELAHVIREERYYSWAYNNYYTTDDGEVIYTPKIYYPLTGRLDGYVVYQDRLYDNRGWVHPHIAGEPVPEGYTLYGAWGINLQLEGYYCHVLLVNYSMEEDVRFHDVSEVVSFLEGFSLDMVAV